MGSCMALPLTVSGDQGRSGSEIKQSPVGTGMVAGSKDGRKPCSHGPQMSWKCRSP